MVRHFKRKALLLFDEHTPFQNKKLWKNKLKLIRSFTFDKIIIGGDFIDCYSISRFEKTPHRAEDLNYEITEAITMLKALRKAAPNAEIIYISGNHSERLQKILDTNMRAFRNLPDLNLKKLLRFDELNIRYHDEYYKLNNKFIVTHGTACCKQSSKAELEKWGISGCSGHVHRYNDHKKNYNEKIKAHPLKWYSFGCGADLLQLDYAKNMRHNWDNSFGIIEYDKHNFNMTVIDPSKQNGSFYNPLEGKLYGKP